MDFLVYIKQMHGPTEIWSCAGKKRTRFNAYDICLHYEMISYGSVFHFHPWKLLKRNNLLYAVAVIYESHLTLARRIYVIKTWLKHVEAAPSTAGTSHIFETAIHSFANDRRQIKPANDLWRSAWHILHSNIFIPRRDLPLGTNYVSAQ